MKKLYQLVRVLLLLAIGAALAGQLHVIVGLRAFEYPFIWRLLGAGGLIYFVFMNVGGLLLALHLWRTPPSTERLLPGRGLSIVLALWLTGGLWLADWIFLETPLSFRVQARLRGDETPAATTDTRGQPQLQAGQLNLSADADVDGVATMLARIVTNRPQVFENYPLVETIDRYARKYGVDPTLTFSWAYLDSFYGEATSGPLPVFAALTAETFRDFVQAHLPSWFIESDVRVTLVESSVLETLAGSRLGFKLRYALQKANYDISVDPFDTSTFTDVFLILKHYPGEFPELFTDAAQRTPVETELRNAFNELRDVGVLDPCEYPYRHAARDEAYYDRYRDDLITFARAAFYRMIFDFDFATRVQTLMARYYLDRYERALGAETWAEVPVEQRLAMVSMLRDVHMTNIGKPSYNLYMLPEFNCTPFAFVADAAKSDIGGVVSTSRLWRPKDYHVLWAGATKKIRVLAEVWEATRGQPFLDAHAARTIEDASRVIAAQR